MKFQRRFTNNFSFLNSYSWGESIDLNSDNDGLVTLTNVYDPEYNRGPSDYDITHTFSSSWIYELPWAREKLYGGWQLAGILFLRSGLPLTVTQTQNVLSTGTGNRPNQTCSGTLSNPTIDRWFDTSCLTPPTDTTGTYGSTGRGTIRGPGQFNIDASLIKNTKIGLRHRDSDRGVQPAEPPAVREPEHADWERRRGHDLGDALEPVVLALRHDRAAGAAWGQGEVPGSGKVTPQTAEYVTPTGGVSWRSAVSRRTG